MARTLGNCLSGATYSRLVDVIGPSRTKDLMFTGRFMPAAEAHACGLVNRIVDADRIEAAVRELATEIAANAPLTHPRDEGNDPPARRPSVVSRPVRTRTWSSSATRAPISARGSTAFLEKRKPPLDGPLTRELRT